MKPSNSSREWHHDNCFVCGKKNPVALGALSPFDDETGEVRFEYNLRPEHEGAPGFSHGGVIATLLDEAQGVLCHHLGHFVMTDQLTIKYHKATPLHAAIVVRAWITSVRRKRLYTRGSIHNLQGELLVSSQARWYDFPERSIRRLFEKAYTPARIDEIMLIIEANRKRAKAIRRRLREHGKQYSFLLRKI